MGSVYIVVLLTVKHNLWGKLREWQDISRKVAGYENPRAGHAPPLRSTYIYIRYKTLRLTITTYMDFCIGILIVDSLAGIFLNF